MIVIPTSAGSDYEEEISLGGVLYRLRFLYNSRDDSWYLSVYEASGALLVAGVRLRLEEPALACYQMDGLPDGVLMVTDPEQTRTEPGRDLLSDTGKALVFVRTEEMG